MSNYNEIMNDYTDNLDLVDRMYKIKCNVMKSGLKKIYMNFYFCSCDPEGNDPICEECKINCHTGEGHTIGERYDGYAVCQCGVRCHKLELNDQDSNNRHVYRPVCNFHEIAYVYKDYRYFLRDEKKICIFCHVFCQDHTVGDDNCNNNIISSDNNNINSYSNLNDKELFFDHNKYLENIDYINSNSYNLNKEKQTDNNYLKNEENLLNKNKDIDEFFNYYNNHKHVITNPVFKQCECDNFLHSDVKNIYKKINEFFDEYKNCLIGNFGPLRASNLISLCEKSYSNIFGSFFTAIKYLNDNIFDPKYEFEKNLSNSNYYWSLIIFGNMGSWCNYIYYFNPTFQNIFSSYLMCGLLNKAYINDKVITNIKSCVITCFQKFNLNTHLCNIPNFKVIDYLNMSPIQRLLITDLIKQNEIFINEFVLCKAYDPTSSEKNNIIDFLILDIEHFTNVDSSLLEVYEILSKTTLLLKKFCKLYLLSEEQVIKFCYKIEKLLDKQLQRRTKLLLLQTDSKKYSKILYKESISILNISKSLIFMLLYNNDKTFLNYISNEKIENKQSNFHVEYIINKVNSDDMSYQKDDFMLDNLMFSHMKNDTSHFIFKSITLLLEYANSNLSFLEKNEDFYLDTSKPISSDNNNPSKIYFELKCIIYKILSNTLELNNILTGIDDVYLQTFKRMIQKNTTFEMLYKAYMNYYTPEEDSFIYFLNKEANYLVKTLNNFFLFKITSESLRNIFKKSIVSVFKELGHSDYVYVGDEDSDIEDDISYFKIQNVIYNKNNKNSFYNIDSGDTIRKVELEYAKNAKLYESNVDYCSLNNKLIVSDREAIFKNYEQNKNNYNVDYKKVEIPSYNSTTAKYRVALNKSNYIFIILKLFFIPSEDGSIDINELIDNDSIDLLFRLLNFFVSGQPDNCIIILSSQVLYSLKMCSYIYCNYCYDLIYHCLSTLINYNYELPKVKKLINILYLLLENNKNKENYYYCLNKFLKINNLIVTKFNNVNYEDSVPILRKFTKLLYSQDPFFIKYKNYLSEISFLYKVNNSTPNDSNNKNNQDIKSKKYLLTSSKETSIYLNKCYDIYTNIDINDNTKLSSICPQTLALKILYKYLCIVNFVYDDSAMFSGSDFLNQLILKEECISILKNLTLDIKLRTQIIKLFRITYIDISINKNKLKEYREQFSREFEVDEDTLIKDEDLKVYLFLENLLEISSKDYLHDAEYQVIINELINFPQIAFGSYLNNDEKISNFISYNFYNLQQNELNSLSNFSYIDELNNNSIQSIINIRSESNDEKNNNLSISLEGPLMHLKKNLKSYKHNSYINNINNYSKEINNKYSIMYYFENSIALPLKIYLNKIFSTAFNMPGKEFIKVYKLCYHFLLVKKCLLEYNIYNINNKSIFKHNCKKNNLTSVINDLKLITDAHFQPLNFVKLYDIFFKQLISLIEKPNTEDLIKYLNTDSSSKNTIDQINSNRNLLLDYLKNQRFLILNNRYANLIQQKNILSNINNKNIEVKLNEFNIIKNINLQSLLTDSIKTINKYNIKDDKIDNIASKSLKNSMKSLIPENFNKDNNKINNLDNNKNYTNIFTNKINNIHSNKIKFIATQNNYYFCKDELLKACDLLKIYTLFMYNYGFSAIETPLEDSHYESSESYRKTYLKNLFKLATQNYFEDDLYINTKSHIVILSLLRNETVKTQEEIMILIKENKNSVNLNKLVDFCFENIMSAIFTQFNPSCFSISEDYYNACNLLKLFKYLCEEHNLFFQKIFCNSLLVETSSGKKIHFFDFMVLIKEKIIMLSGWNKIVHSQIDFIKEIIVYKIKYSLNNKNDYAQDLLNSYDVNNNDGFKKYSDSNVNKINRYNKAIEINNQEIFSNDNNSMNLFSSNLVSCNNINNTIINKFINEYESQDGNINFYFALFNCLSDLLIEIVQGSSSLNFNSIYLIKNEEDFLQTNNDYNSTHNSIIHNDTNSSYQINKVSNYVYNKISSRKGLKLGDKNLTSNFINYNNPSIKNKSSRLLIQQDSLKAIFLYLNTIKPLLFNDKNNSTIVYNSRTQLAYFILSFLEENNCNDSIKSIIISSINAEDLIKSIVITLKKLYYKNQIKLNSYIDEKDITDKNLLLLSNKNILYSNENNVYIEYISEVDNDYYAKKLIFNKDLFNYFSKNYFLNEAMSQYPEFEFALALYRILKIYTIEFSDNEAIYFIMSGVNKIDNNSQEFYNYDRLFSESNNKILSAVYAKPTSCIDFEKLNDVNNICNNCVDNSIDINKSDDKYVNNKKSDNNYKTEKYVDNLNNNDNNERINETNNSIDIATFENYYIISFFNQLVKCIKIKLQNKKEQNVIFAVIPKNNMYSQNSKDEFLKNVSRENQYTKLSGLIVESEYFYEEILYSSEMSQKSQIYKFANYINYHKIKVAVYIYALMLNILLFFLMPSDTGKGFSNINSYIPLTFKVLTWSIIGFNLFIILIWCITKMPLIYKIEIKKVLQYKKLCYSNTYELTNSEKANIFLFKSFLFNNDISLFVWIAIFCIIGIINIKYYGLFSFILLGVIALNDTFYNVVLSFKEEYNQLLWTIGFNALAIYVFAFIGVYYFAKYFTNKVCINKVYLYFMFYIFVIIRVKVVHR